MAPRNKMVIAVEEVGKSIDVLSEALSEALTGMLGAYGKLETAMSASAVEVASTKPAGKPSTASTGRRAAPVPVDDEDLDEEPAPRRGRPVGSTNKPTTRRPASVEEDEDDDVNPATPYDAPAPARRGRPPGSGAPKRVTPEVVDDDEDLDEPAPARRGRPAGSTNKPRATAAPVPARKPRPVVEPDPDDDFNDDDFDDSEPAAEADGEEDNWASEWAEDDEPAPKAGRRGR